MRIHFSAELLFHKRRTNPHQSNKSLRKKELSSQYMCVRCVWQDKTPCSIIIGKAVSRQMTQSRRLTYQRDILPNSVVCKTMMPHLLKKIIFWLRTLQLFHFAWLKGKYIANGKVEGDCEQQRRKYPITNNLVLLFLNLYL
jgi:hypothetical protein